MIPAADSSNIITNCVNNSGRKNENSADISLSNRIKSPFKRRFTAKNNIAFG
jgi:hypothetical protein